MVVGGFLNFLFIYVIIDTINIYVKLHVKLLVCDTDVLSITITISTALELKNKQTNDVSV